MSFQCCFVVHFCLLSLCRRTLFYTSRLLLTLVLQYLLEDVAMLSCACQPCFFFIVLQNSIPSIHESYFLFHRWQASRLLPIPCNITSTILSLWIIWTFLLETHPRLELLSHGVYIILISQSVTRYYYDQQYTSIPLAPNSWQQLVLLSGLFVSSGYIVVSHDHFNSHLSSDKWSWTFYICHA